MPPEDEASDPDRDDAASFSEPYSSRKARPTGMAFFFSPAALADTADECPLADDDNVKGAEDAAGDAMACLPASLYG